MIAMPLKIPTLYNLCCETDIFRIGAVCETSRSHTDQYHLHFGTVTVTGVYFCHCAILVYRLGSQNGGRIGDFPYPWPSG